MLARRQAATEAVIKYCTAQPLGGMTAEIFILVRSSTHRFLKFRDDERHFPDRRTFQKKRLFSEVGRRMHERGLLAGAEDFFFLARPEFYDLFDGRAQQGLSRAKVAARRRVFERRNARTEYTPTYLQPGVTLNLDNNSDEVQVVDGALRGVGTSRGEVSGRARVVRSLQEIGRVEKDDILIFNSTDPGWLPVLPPRKGLVPETGGMLAHRAVPVPRVRAPRGAVAQCEPTHRGWRAEQAQRRQRRNLRHRHSTNAGAGAGGDLHCGGPRTATETSGRPSSLSAAPPYARR